MSGRWWLTVGCLAGGWAAAAEPSTVAVPPRLPPHVLPLPPDPDLPGGATVSRPLQPVQAVEVAPLPEPSPLPPTGVEVKPGVLTEAELERTEAAKPLGRSWETLEYLVWWPKAHPLPPLVTAGRGPTPPALGSPGTQVLVGGSAIDNPELSGGRFTLGTAVNEAETVGLAVTYFFLGTRTSSATASDLGVGRPRWLGRPIVNAATGQNDAVPVSWPGVMTGTVTAATSTRATGWEVGGLANLYAGPFARLNAVAGYRYFSLNEGLRVDQYAFFPGGPGQPPTLVGAADQFDAHTRFHGGQLGLSADLTRGPVFVEATGKVALGQAIAVTKVSGQTTTISPGWPIPGLLFSPGGVLAQPSNSGRFSRSAFAVLPETTVKVGYRFRDRSRFYVGYNFIYLSEAVRPGEQVDPTVDPSQVPLLGRAAGVLVGAERPAPTLTRSDFWVQGLLFGLEYRY